MRRFRLFVFVLLPLLLAVVRLVGRSRRRRVRMPSSSTVESGAPDAFGAAVAEVAERRSR